MLIKELRDFDSLTKNMQDIITIIDNTCMRQYVSPSVENILGYSPSELVGESIFNNIHPEDVLHVKSTLEKAYHFLTSGVTTCRYKHKNGHYVWLEIRGNIILDKNNNREGAILNARDVSQQIEYENRLRNSEALYKLLTENSNDVVALINSDKQVVYVSPAVHKLLGYTPDELKSLLPFNIYHPEDAQSVIDELKQGKKESKYRVRLKHKSGHFIWVEIASHRLFNEDGVYLKSVINVRDVHDEVLAYQKVIENEKKLKEIQRVAKIGSWKYNFQTREIILSDEKLYMLELPYTRKKITIAEFINDFMAEDPKTFSRIINEAIQQKDPEPIRNFTYKIKTARGNFKYFLIDSVKKEENYLVGVTKDITDQRIYQDELMAKNIELKKINSELDQFVYRTSHNLRSPLVSALGLIHLLNITTDEEERNKYINIIKQRIIRLDESIKEINDYYKNARLEISIEKFSLKYLVSQIINEFSYSNHFNKIDFQVTGEVDEIVSDPFRVRNILHNIIGNAIKYQNPYEENKLVKINFKADDKNYIINVEDNGIGIHQDEIDKIFTMFYRANDNKEGLGLGLFIVKESLERINGTCFIESKLGSGTKFTVKFPKKIQG